MKRSISLSNCHYIERNWFSSEVIRENNARSLKFHLTTSGIEAIQSLGLNELHLEYWTRHQKEISKFDLQGKVIVAPLRTDTASVKVQAICFDPKTGKKLAKSDERKPNRSDDDLHGGNSFLPVQLDDDLGTLWKFSIDEGTLYIHSNFAEKIDHRSSFDAVVSNFILPEIVRQVSDKYKNHPKDLDNMDESTRDAWEKFIKKLGVDENSNCFGDDCAEAFAEKSGLNNFTHLINALNHE